MKEGSGVWSVMDVSLHLRSCIVKVVAKSYAHSRDTNFDHEPIKTLQSCTCFQNARYSQGLTTSSISLCSNIM